MRLRVGVVAIATVFVRFAHAHPDEAAQKDPYSTVVEGDRTPPPKAASDRHVTAETIAATPRRTGDDLLRLVPNLLVTKHGAEGKGVQIFLRGFDAVHGSDVEVTVAGIPVNEASNVHGQGYLDLGFVMPEVVSSIDAAKGSFRLEQGNFATAGSIAFELAVPRAQRGTRVGYEVGTSNRHRVFAVHAPRDLPSSTFVAVEAMHDDGFGQNRATDRVMGLGQVRLYRAPGGGRLDLFGTLYAALFGEPGAVPLADVERGTLGFLDTWSDDTLGTSQRAITALRWRDDVGPSRTRVTAWAQRRRLVLRENFTGFLLDETRGDERRQAHMSTTAGMRLVWERDLARPWTLVLGGSAWGDWFTQSEDRTDEAGVAWRRDRDVDAVQGGGDAQAGVRLRGGGWLIEAGGRIDVFHFAVDDLLVGETGSDTMPGTKPETMIVVSPRAQVVWRPSHAWALFASYGRGLRAPEARSVLNRGGAGENENLMQYDGGDPHVTTSDSVEAGARWHLGDVVSTGVAGFGTWIANEVVFDHVSGVNVELNATRRLGVETDVTVRPTHWLEVRADATVVDARFIGSGNPIPGAPTLFATLTTSVQEGAWRAAARAMVLGPRPLAHGATAGAAVVVDVTAGWRAGRWSVDLQVDNALDADWREGEYHYASWFDRSEPRSGIPRIHYTAGPPLTLRAALTARF